MNQEYNLPVMRELVNQIEFTSKSRDFQNMKLTGIFSSIVHSFFWKSAHLHVLYIFDPKSCRCNIGFVNNIVVMH